MPKSFSFVVYLSMANLCPQIDGLELAEIKLSFKGITEILFSKINIQKDKCTRYEEVEKKPNHFVKMAHIEIQKAICLERSGYEEFIQEILEYISGDRSSFEVTKSNQFDFIYLCDLFNLQDAKHCLLTHISQNVDVSNVFEFLLLSSQEPDNKESLRESYWVIVFIYLRKIAYDISDSFQNEKTKQMLHNVNPFDFNFAAGFLVHEPSQKKVCGIPVLYYRSIWKLS